MIPIVSECAFLLLWPSTDHNRLQGGDGFFGSCSHVTIHLSPWEVRVETQGGNWSRGPRGGGEGRRCLLACSSWMAQPAFLVKAGPPSIKEMPHRQAHRPVWWRQFFRVAPSSHTTLICVMLKKLGTTDTFLICSSRCRKMRVWVLTVWSFLLHQYPPPPNLSNSKINRHNLQFFSHMTSWRKPLNNLKFSHYFWIPRSGR